MNIEIDSYWELVALHKSLMAVKFDPNSYLKEAQGSPYTGSLAFKVFQLLVESCRADGKDEEAEKWLQWQQADESRSETELLKKTIKEESWWTNAGAEARMKFVEEFMAPLKLK